MAEDLTGKWSYSIGKGEYSGRFDTKEEAIAACRREGGGHVGQLRKPDDPWSYITAADVIDQVAVQDDYSHDAADDCFNCSNEKLEELTSELQQVFKSWCERHRQLPDHYMIDTDTIEEVGEPADE